MSQKNAKAVPKGQADEEEQPPPTDRPVYWSVLHHKNVNVDSPADLGDDDVHERQTLLAGPSTRHDAYDALSDTMKSILDPLQALHTDEVHRNRYEQVGGGLRRDERPSAVHPVIRTHPETGRKLIYVNQPFTQSIVGMTQAESDALLNFLYAHVSNPRFHCRFRWEPNSVAFWDNRCTQHHATWDYYPQVRSGIRVTIAGDKPFH